MALFCYNKGCGEKFEPKDNNDEACLHHPGVPIFHDALKGWSCCKKRTTDFSEFLGIKGCTRGRHSNVKPQEPLRPEVSSDKGDVNKHSGAGQKEIIYRGPKSAETLQKEKTKLSSDEAKTRLPGKVSANLSQILKNLDLSAKAEQDRKEGEEVRVGTRCKNSGCQSTYEGPATDSEVCTHHPGAPVFHEGYKYWSCCCISTLDFNSFLEQKGCSGGKHRWVAKQGKKKAACRFDWHQTGNSIVVTIYSKNPNPALSCIEGNRTVLSCQIQFEENKVFTKEFHFWGVVDISKSSVNMVPSKTEITLRKADAVSWAKLEDPNYKAPPEPAEDASSADPVEAAADEAADRAEWDIADDDISDSDDEEVPMRPEEAAWRKQLEELDVTKRKKAEAEADAKRKESHYVIENVVEDKKAVVEREEQLQREKDKADDLPDLDMPDLED